MAIWVSSDFHFGHDREFIWKARGFENVQEMNETIVKNCCEHIINEDTFYILGDAMLGGSNFLEEGLKLLSRIPGHKIIIAGNHDTPVRRKAYEDCGIPVYDATTLTYRKLHFYLSHYPTIVTNLDENESLKTRTLGLYGHTHQRNNFYNDNPYIYHVGVDSHNCCPVLLDNIIEEMKTKVQECKELL